MKNAPNNEIIKNNVTIGDIIEQTKSLNPLAPDVIWPPDSSAIAFKPSTIWFKMLYVVAVFIALYGAGAIVNIKPHYGLENLTAIANPIVLQMRDKGLSAFVIGPDIILINWKTNVQLAQQ